MSVLRPVNFRLDVPLIEGLREVRQRDGIPVTEQVRRAVQAWLESKGIKVKAGRKRAATRKRP